MKESNYLVILSQDLSLAQMASTDTNSPTPLGSMAYNFYKQLSNQGLANKDFAYVYEYIKSKSSK